MTFLFPSWRSLNHLKRSLNHPKKVTKNCQGHVCFFFGFKGWIDFGSIFEGCLKMCMRPKSIVIFGFKPIMNTHCWMTKIDQKIRGFSKVEKKIIPNYEPKVDWRVDHVDLSLVFVRGQWLVFICEDQILVCKNLVIKKLEFANHNANSPRIYGRKLQRIFIFLRGILPPAQKKKTFLGLSPPPRMPVTIRIITFLGSGIPN